MPNQQSFTQQNNESLLLETPQLKCKLQSKYSEDYSLQLLDRVEPLIPIHEDKIFHHDHQLNLDLLIQKQQQNKPSNNKQQMIASLKQSYKILSNVQKNIQSPNPQRKSLNASKQSDDIKHPIQLDKIVQNLKAPLNINMEKINSKKSIRLDEINSQILIKDNQRKWSKMPLEIDLLNETLKGFNINVLLNKIDKIKIFKPDFKKQLFQVKITYQKDKSGKKNQQNFVINIKSQQVQKISRQFTVFAQILTQKLKAQHNFKQTKWQKSVPLCEQIIYGSFVFGDIYKKSQHFGKWQKRFIVVNNKGIYSYKNVKNKEDYTFSIEKESIQELWTRFQMINEYLIIKLRHGVKKTQLGIPVMNFTQATHKNWLFYIFKLMNTKN